jgi:probable HAF family extracellular repeat protein
MQRGYVMVLAVFLLVLGTAVVASATTYNYTVLPAYSTDVISIANAVANVNGTPEAVGYSRNSGKTSSEPLLWINGVATNLNTALGASATKLSGGYNQAYGIDSNGDIVGVCNHGGVFSDFYLPASGSPTFLPFLGASGAASAATGVSNTGLVVGYGTNASGTPQAFVWSAAGMVDLGTTGVSSYASAVSPNGQYIVGGTGTSGSLGQALEWQLEGSTWTQIGELSLSLSNQSGAMSVNNSGEVMGVAFPPYTGGPPSTSTYAFIANAGFSGYTTFGSGAVNTTLPTSGLGGINSSGAVVWTDSTTGPPMYNAAPTSGVDATSLSTLLAPGQGTGWTMQGATGIDDSGDISVQYSTGSANRAALLTPVPTPEPSTLLLAASALLGIVAYAWRRNRRAS